MSQETVKKPQNGDPTLDEIKELYDFMCKESLDEIEVSRKDFSLRMARNCAARYAYKPAMQYYEPAVQAAPQSCEPEQPKQGADNGCECIKAPLTGTFYRAASPKSSPFVNDGDKVQAGATLCILEAMKVMNEIKAEKACKIVKIIAENGKMVKAGDVLFSIG